MSKTQKKIRAQILVLVCTLVCVCRDGFFIWHMHTPGEFGVVYKAHLVKSMQQMPEIVAVKTLKG